MASQSLSYLSSYENLVWAWYKLRNTLRHSEVWYDELALAEFELCLDKELASLADDLRSGKYRQRPIRPLPYPKKTADGDMEVRQYFWLTIRDQLAWLAYLNVIGADLDSQMPAWSYGNRLFRSMIVNVNEFGIPRFTSGPYRNTRGYVYRPFKQSWPLYRRHVLLALKKLTRPGLKLSFEEREKQLLEVERQLDPHEQLVYLQNSFWHQRSKTVYWCSFDLEKFYPSIRLDLIQQLILSRSQTARSLGTTLLESLTEFEIDRTGFSAADLAALALSDQKNLPVIPTGLIAAGFLANVAMLDVDNWVSTQVRKRQVAHFRYVDDHIVVAPSFQALSEWFLDYQRYLVEHTGCKVNQDKTQPKQFRLYLEKQNRKRKTAAMAGTWVDPAFPSPLMTKTLEKVSNLAHTNFDLLDSEEQHRVLNDLEHLLLAQLPEEELPEKTRVTFAATLLGRFTAAAEHDRSDLLSAILDLNETSQLERDIQRQLRTLRRSSSPFRELRLSLRECQQKRRVVQAQVRRLKLRSEQKREALNKQTTAVLLKALESHPERLRMWERVLEFARRSGGSATIVVDAIRNVEAKHRLSSTSIKARLMQVFARQCASCTSDYFNRDLSLDRRLHSAAYLASVPLAIKRLRFPSRYYYLTETDQLLTLAQSFSLFSLQVNPRSVDLPSTPGIRLRAALRRTSRPIRFEDIEPRAIWWLARNFFLWNPEQRQAVQEMGLSSLPPQLPESWKMWRYLGVDIRETAFRRVAQKGTLDRGVEGWVAEVLYSKSPKCLRRLKSVGGPIGRVAKTLTGAGRARLTLADWVRWTASQERKPFDPRLSEWTALEIAVQIAEIVRRQENELRQEVVSSIFNFTIPKTWIKKPVEELTWENWRLCTNTEKVKARVKLRLRDGRIIPGISDYPDLNLDFGSVRATVAILLSLLRRDFRMPGQFLTTGFQGIASKAAIMHIQERPCSSRTMAILESCLMDRSVETLWMRQDETEAASRHLEQDIVRDIPLIENLGALIDELQKAQDVLTDYQLTVSAHQPRQLIPVYLEQYTSSNWRPPERDYDEQGEEIE